VLRAGDGSALLERRAIPTLVGLFPQAALVTPNLPEAEALAGRDVSTRAGVEAAARTFLDGLGAPAVLVKGGHRAGAPDDLLAVREAGGVVLRWLPGERLPGARVHGTGCALAAAVAAGLALGAPLYEAVARARSFVAAGIRRAEAPGGGARLLVHDEPV
jgi:hydroxymethylpyrimidine kinase/phosphomethylpyrimidine kinase